MIGSLIRPNKNALRSSKPQTSSRIHLSFSTSQRTMNSISRSIVPAIRRAASTAVPAAKQQAAGVASVLYAVPPLLAGLGYGGIVCLDDTGALRRIQRSFAEVPH